MSSAAAGPIQTASSAILACKARRSAVEYTATVLIPNSRHARIMRIAIVPRFATKTFLNTVLTAPLKASLLIRALPRLQYHQRLTVADGLCVLTQNSDDAPFYFGRNLIHHLHCLDNTQWLAFSHHISLLNKGRSIGRRRAIKGSNHRASHQNLVGR